MVASCSFADENQAQLYEQTIHEYRNANQGMDAILKQEKLNELLPGYTENVDEKNLFGDTTQISDDLERKGLTAATQNETTKAVLDGFSERPVVKINLNNPDIQNAQAVEENADAFLDGDFATPRCNIVNTEKSCTESVRVLLEVCDQTPTITIEEKEIQHQESLTGNIPAQTNTQGTFTVPYDGVIQAFSATLKSNNVWLCHRTYVGKINDVLISQMQGQCHKYLGDLHFSNKNLSIRVQKKTPIAFELVGFAKGKWQWTNFELTMMANESKKTAKVTWQEGCRYV